MTSEPLLMLSSMATRELLRELAGRHRRERGQAVEAQAAGGVEVAKRIRAGDRADVVVLAAKVIDELIGEGHLAGPRRDLVRSGVGIAIPRGRPRPDVSTEAAVRTAVLAAPSLSYSTGPSGVFLQQLFERWGIYETVQPRIVVPPPGTPVGALVADGRAALGFQQLSELIDLEGIDLLGPLPDEIQTMTVFSGAATRSCARPDEARALLDFLAAPDAADVKRRFGMEPA